MRVIPKVFLIASSRLHSQAVANWLDEVDGGDCLDHITGSDGEALIELAGRNCYKSFKAGLNKNVTKVRKDSEEYHENILTSGHGSVLEHTTATFAFENVSRVFTHELVRHRQGMAFSQQSLRYVRLDDIKMWLPEIIDNNAEARTLFENTTRAIGKAIGRLYELFQIDSLTMTEKKFLTSAFRRIAPIGLATSIVATFNMRSLRWVIEMRTNRVSEVEIRKVFCEVFEIAQREWPMLFQDFNKVDTGDGLFEAVPKNRKV